MYSVRLELMDSTYIESVGWNWTDIDGAPRIAMQPNVVIAAYESMPACFKVIENNKDVCKKVVIELM